MLYLVLGFIALAYLGANIYMYVKCMQMMHAAPAWVKVDTSVLFLICFLSFFVSMVMRKADTPLCLLSCIYMIGTAWLVFTLYMTLALILTDVLRIWWHDMKYWGFIVSFVIVVPLLGFGYMNYRHPDVNTYEIQVDKPMSSDVKIVGISDVHLGIGTGRKALSRYVDMIMKEKPDVILIAGDLIDNSVVPLYRQNMIEELARLKAPMGVYMALGNHEYISGIEESLDFLEKTPITVLRDSVVTLSCGLQIAGNDDYGKPEHVGIGSFIGQADMTRPFLLLDHFPGSVAYNSTLGVDIQFSGHTHGGQIWPGNYIVDMLYEQSSGGKWWNETFVYVSSGLSLWGPPFRIGTDSDMLVLKVRGK